MKKGIIISSVLVSMLIGGGYFFQNVSKADNPVVPKSVLSVNIKKPFFQELATKEVLTGNVLPWQESVITSELNGMRITSVPVEVGNVVKKGQTLATLKGQTVFAEYNQAKATFMEALANLKQAKETAARANELDQTGALSSQQLSQYQTSQLTAGAKVEAAKSQLIAQGIRVSQTKITAPDEGIISSRNATVGSLVNGGELFRIILKEKLQWKAQIASDYLDKVKIGQDVEILTKSGDILIAKVNEISPIVNEKTRQGTLLVDLEKEVYQNKLKAGMFISGNLLMEKNNVMLIDQQAVVLRDGFNYVFVLKPDNRVKQTKVNVGIRVGNNIQIKKNEVINSNENNNDDKKELGISKMQDNNLDKIPVINPTNNTVVSNKVFSDTDISYKDNIVITGATFLKDQDLVKVIGDK